MTDALHRRSRQCLKSYPCRCIFKWTEVGYTCVQRCVKCILIEDLDVVLDPAVTP